MNEIEFYPKEFKLEAHKPVFACLSDGENKYITETAGFVPLEVKLKQFEQNGLRAQFHEAEFTSSDYRDMYLNPDFEIYPGDELEEVQEKAQMQREFIAKRLQELKTKNSKVGSLEKTADSPSGSAAAHAEDSQASEPKEEP